jgi:hypothetical protein
VATATHVGTAFYVFGLILLPTLAFVGLVTFERVLQTGVEDRGYAQRLARLRGYYFDNAPELTPYLLSVPADHQLGFQGPSHRDPGERPAPVNDSRASCPTSNPATKPKPRASRRPWLPRNGQSLWPSLPA